MKIQFNQTIKNYNSLPIKYSNRIEKTETDIANGSERVTASTSGLTLANFPNISFRMNCDMKFLLSQTDRLRCAYSGRDMISPFEIRTIYAKLAKRPNAQSAINFLTQYQDYMHDIESTVFDLFKESPYKGKRDFQDILQEYQPEALLRLKEKQINILTSTDKIMESLSEPVAAQVAAIRNESIARMENGTFGRKAPLELIKRIKAEGSDLQKIIKIYQAWYKLPSSSKDFDAFVVKYSKEPHDAIARRLISSAVATVEHVKPKSRGGEDDLSNFILVSARFNNERNTMPLDEYMMLNRDIDIKKHLQRYVDDVINQVGNKKSKFAQWSWYPEAIKKTINAATSGKVVLGTESLRLTKEQMRNNSTPQRLSKKYVVHYK